jgi:hypothetical protein
MGSLGRLRSSATGGLNGRVFGAANIKRVVELSKPDHGAKGQTSIADQPHAGNREAERRRRQLERKAKRK